MHVVKPTGRKLKYDLRFKNHDGQTVRVPGDLDLGATRRLGDRISTLIRYKANDDPPPAELKSWIDNMPQAVRVRLVNLGLLAQERFERLRPIAEHVEDFEKIVAARKTNTATHAGRQAAIVRRLIAAMKVTNLNQVSEDKVALTLSAMPIQAATRRHYVIAFKDFCKWMVKSKRARENPVADLQPPALYADPSIERVPLTQVQFQTLMAYLGTFERYKQQKARWTAFDRKLVYWTAVLTAYRQNELRTLKVNNLILDTKPAMITIRAANAKNRMRGAVPIRAELADALKAYVQGRDPDESLFLFPATNHGIVEMFRKDLDGAGIKWNFGEDSPYTIDFHTLRSTAITWWIDTPNMTVKKVQTLARLKTPGLVAAYSRNYQMDDYGWLEEGPSLVAPPMPEQAKAGEM